jgi:serine/threonine-protein kinase
MTEPADGKSTVPGSGASDKLDLQSLLDDQAACWLSGERIRVEDYLARLPSLHASTEAMVDLITNEVLLRRQAGEAPQLDEYLQRFPQLSSQLRIQFEIEGVIEGQLPLPRTVGGGASHTRHSIAPPPLDRLPVVPGYDILEELGRGGMGVVFKARQIELDRIVALKMILPPPIAASEELAALLVRLRGEALAISRLKHPDIVQIFDRGEYNGLTYLVLEYVEGGSLARKLAGVPQPAQQAAALLERLARAMQAAHQAGVLHRDLKPANVLLTSDGSPKISDFGLAKRLDDPVGQTASAAWLGTPCYMAPEQAAGRNREVGVPADVYALGSILYELLTGRPPFRAVTVADTLQQVKTDDPVPPSRLAAKVPRDLETICLKCLLKEPSWRYPSAGALADDLRRFLAGEPIHAHPASRAERLLRWTRRRPAAAALVVVSVVAGLALVIGAFWHTIQLQAALDRAEDLGRERQQQYERAEANLSLADDVVDEMVTWVGHRRLANVPQMEQARSEVLERAVKLHQRLLQEDNSNPKLRLRTALSLDRLAESYRLLGRRDQAEKVQRQAIDMHEKLTAEFPTEADHRRNLAGSYHNLSIQFSNARRYPEADRAERHSIDLYDKLAQESPARPLDRKLLADGHNHLGNVLWHSNQRGEAIKCYRHSLAILEKLVASPGADPSWRQSLGLGYNNLGHVLGVSGQTKEAETAMRRAVVLFEELSTAQPGRAFVRQNLAGCDHNLGAFLCATNRLPEGEKHLRRSLQRREYLARDFPTIPEYRRDLAKSQDTLSRLLWLTKRPTEAAQIHRQSLATQEKLVSDFPRETGDRQTLAARQRSLLDMLLKMGHREQAEAVGGLVLGLYDKLAAESPAATDWRKHQAEIKKMLGRK